ncbi:MAG: hypothetical protein BWX77_00700 [Bacteroidetes bacterium ADurb.Bin090]|nr:MAG: hypothetical protein BWX77_00700 [Bacteroidetes bacterium ADurb.Bin090]
MYGNQAHFFAFLHQIVDDFFGGFGNGAHRNDNTFGVGRAVIGEGFVFTAGQLVDFLHITGNDIGHCLIKGIERFPVLEEMIGVFGHSPHYGFIGIHGASPESSQRFPVDQRRQILGIEHLDFLHFVRSTETVEEVHERHPAFNGSQMGNSR